MTQRIRIIAAALAVITAFGVAYVGGRAARDAGVRAVPEHRTVLPANELPAATPGPSLPKITADAPPLPPLNTPTPTATEDATATPEPTSDPSSSPRSGDDGDADSAIGGGGGPAGGGAGGSSDRGGGGGGIVGGGEN